VFPFVAAAVLLVFVAFLLAIVWWSLPSRGDHARTRARTDAYALVSAVELFHAQDSSARCPGIEDLERDILSSNTRSEDPWRRAFRIRCIGQQDVEVMSAGPDRMFGTPDDIIERNRRRTRVARAVSPDSVSMTLAHDTDAEDQTQAQLAALLADRDVERYLHTRALVIDEDAIPHSHPVLTLHTRHLDDDGLLLSTFLHEQLHWFLVARPEARDAAVAELRERFPALPVGYPDGASDEQSSYEHLIVNHLERLAVRAVLGEDQAERTQAFWRGDHYRALYVLEQTDGDEIHAILERHGLLP
jgi:hypothetical protein